MKCDIKLTDEAVTNIKDKTVTTINSLLDFMLVSNKMTSHKKAYIKYEQPTICKALYSISLMKLTIPNLGVVQNLVKVDGTFSTVLGKVLFLVKTGKHKQAKRYICGVAVSYQLLLVYIFTDRRKAFDTFSEAVDDVYDLQKLYILLPLPLMEQIDVINELNDVVELDVPFVAFAIKMKKNSKIYFVQRKDGITSTNCSYSNVVAEVLVLHPRILNGKVFFYINSNKKFTIIATYTRAVNISKGIFGDVLNTTSDVKQFVKDATPTRNRILALPFDASNMYDIEIEDKATPLRVIDWVNNDNLEVEALVVEYEDKVYTCPAKNIKDINLKFDVFRFRIRKIYDKVIDIRFFKQEKNYV